MCGLLHSSLLKVLAVGALPCFLFAETDFLEPMVIIEKRVDQPFSELSPWVSRIEQDEWQGMQTDGLAETLRTVPGMLIVKTGQVGAQASLYSRGTQSDHTVVLLDGRKLNGGFSGLYNLGQLGLGGYSAIEVMRGPTSLQYGSEGMGAAISFRSMDLKSLKTNRSDLVLEGGSFATGKAALEQSIVGEGWAMGWSANARSSENDRAHSQYDSHGGTLSFRKVVSEALVLDLVGTGFESGLELPGPTYSPSHLDYQDSYNYLISPGFSLSGDEWQVLAHYTYGTDWVDSYTAGTWGSYRTVGKSVQQQTELVHRIELSDSLAWRGGLSFLDQSFQMSEDAEIDQRRNTKAIHGSFDWRPSDSIEWSAGIRAEDHSSYENPVIGSLSAKWALQEGFALHGRWAEGFSPPTGNDLYFPGSGNPDLKPEEGRTMELGISVGSRQSAWAGNLTFFETEMEQLIEFGMPNSNIGEIEIQGIELSTEVRMTESLRGFLSWTFLDAENRSSQEDFLDRRPENSGNLGLEWNAVRSKFGLSATVRKQMMERDFSAWPSSWVAADDFLVARMYGSTEIAEHMTLFARVENLFDEEYEEVHGYPGLGRGIYCGFNYSF